MSDKIDWNKVEAMADAMTDADIALSRGQKMYTPEEGRKAYLEFRKNARKRQGRSHHHPHGLANSYRQ